MSTTSDNAVIDCGLNPVSGDAAFSLAWWMKWRTNTGTQGFIFTMGPVGGGKSIRVYRLAAGNFVFSTEGVDAMSVDCPRLINGGWHHVVMTRPLGAGKTKVYIDGALHATSANSVSANVDPAGHLFWAGYVAGVAALMRIYDCRVYGEELNATRIADLFAGENDGDLNLLRHHPMDNLAAGLTTERIVPGTASVTNSALVTTDLPFAVRDVSA